MLTHRREFLKLAVAAAGGGLFLPGSRAGAEEEAAPTKAPEKPRPDVLFIVVDDLNTDMGCYGHAVVKTPHLDALAARGVRFDRAYCPFPLCNPSRTAVLTGLRPEHSTVCGNEQDWREIVPKSVATLPEHFRAQGYDTVGLGKIFHDPFEDPARWNRWISNVSEGLPPAKRDMSQVRGPKEPQEAGTKRSDLKWGPTCADDLGEIDGRVAERAGQILQEQRDKPLFLAVGFRRTHLPWHAPAKYFTMYPPEQIELPKIRPDELEDVPKLATAAGVLLDQHRLTAENWKEAVAAYYACVSYVDASVGRLLAALKKSGRADRTIVVFWGDHGQSLGEMGLWHKSVLFERSVRTPLLIAAPGAARAGAVCRQPAELMDLYPTLVDLCGLPPPAHELEGASMAPLLKDPERPWKKCAFSCVNRKKDILNYTLRTTKWRYTEWGGPDLAELYDEEKDPEEHVNLVQDPAHAGVLKEMQELMKAGWRNAAPR